MNHPDAERLALQLREELRPYCRRIEIAGSIRRGCATVRDLELVAIPLWEPRLAADAPEDAKPQLVNTLHEWATGKVCPVRWIKTGTPPEVIVDWQIKPDGKYWRGITGNGIHLDLFLPGRDNWGWIYTVRTGSREFSTALAQRAAAQGMPADKGFLHRGEKTGPLIATPEEADVFRLLGLELVAPKDRTGEEALRPLRAAPKPEIDRHERWRPVYQLARRLGYPDGIARYCGMVVSGGALWGYACTSARPAELERMERELREYEAARTSREEVRRAA